MLTALKQNCLQAAGFAPIATNQAIAYAVANRAAAYVPASEIRYEHTCQAQDGTRLYVYSWLDAPGYLLTTKPRITALKHIIAELDTDDPQELEHAVQAFFAKHGGAQLYPAPGIN